MAAPPPLVGPSRLLEDRYLDGTRLRLRRETGPGGVVGVWKLARKYGPAALGIEPMTNLYLAAEEHRLLATLPAATVVKRRWALWEEGVRYVLDVFEGALAGRMIAEVELSEPEPLWALTPPGWCGPEITGDARYSGAALARGGWPDGG